MQRNLTEVDWLQLPVPEDDGGAVHLPGLTLPSCPLPATGGGVVDLAALKGMTVAYLYPATGRPDQPLPEGWDAIPGARGCTPQSCAFRDHHGALRALGMARVFGVSTQDSAEQEEAAARLHLPFALLSDAALGLVRALRLPVFEHAGKVRLKRMTWIIEDGRILHCFYPVFPPDRNAGDVIDWLKAR